MQGAKKWWLGVMWWAAGVTTTAWAIAQAGGEGGFPWAALFLTAAAVGFSCIDD